MTDPRSKSSAGIVERLRAHKGFWFNGGAWMMSTQPDADCVEAAEEIERLRKGWKKEADKDCKWALKEIKRLRAALLKLIEQIENRDDLPTDEARRALEGK